MTSFIIAEKHFQTSIYFPLKKELYYSLQMEARCELVAVRRVTSSSFTIIYI